MIFLCIYYWSERGDYILILFHGTSYKRGKNIIKEKRIRVDASKIYDYTHPMPTTHGFIYLTPDIAIAAFYGNIASIYDKDKEFIVFKIKVDKNLLKPDYDEKNYTLKFKKKESLTLDESLKLLKSCAIDRDICFENFESYYVVIPTTLYPLNDSDLKRKQLYKDVRELLNKREIDDMEFRNYFMSKLDWSKL